MSGPAAHAEQGAEAWRAVVHDLHGSNPGHGDFYALGAEIDATLRSLEAAARVLATQVTRYGRTPRLYDDSGTVDPHRRLADAAASLKQLAATLAQAQRHASTYWSAIGHIGVGPDR